MTRRALASSLARIVDIDIPTMPGGSTSFTDRIAALQAQGVTVHRWGRSVDTSGTTYAMQVGANGTIVNPVAGDYNQGALLENSNGGSSIGLSGVFPDPTYISFASVTVATFEFTIFVQLDRVVPGVSAHPLVVGDGGANNSGGAECKLVPDGAGDYRFRFHSGAAAGGHVVKEGSTAAQVGTIGETVMLSYLREAANMRCFLNATERTMNLISGALETWAAPAAGTSYVGAYVAGAGESDGLDGLLGEWLITSPLTTAQRIFLADHARRDLVIAKAINGGFVAEGSSPVSFAAQDFTHPSIGTLVVSTPASPVGTLSAGAASLVYTPPASVSADTPVTAAYTTSFGETTTPPASFSITVQNAAVPPSSTLPEDAPLPTALVIKPATTSTFDSVMSGANPGDRIDLAGGSYGGKTISRSGTLANPIVIRSTSLHNAVFSGINITGTHIILSGVQVDLGSASEAGFCVSIPGSNIRITRCILRNGGYIIAPGTNATDLLIDHCDISRSRSEMFRLVSPPNQNRITVARCWCHDMLAHSTNNFSMGFAWIDENIYRERPINKIIRFNYIGPSSHTPTFRDWLHDKSSNSLYAFNRLDSPTHNEGRFGLRRRMVGNYCPGAGYNAWDSLGWFYGNVFGTFVLPAGRSHYYDDTKNLAAGANNSVGGFHAHNRSRFSGNNFAAMNIGEFGASQNWCSGTAPDPATLPDPLGAGAVKEQRSFNGITYVGDDPLHVDVGIKIRAHQGTITLRPNTCPQEAWVQNLNSAPASAAPANWLSELLAQYPWISNICPDPTSLTGGPGGSAPWSVAQALTRGDAATPNTGPFRNSPGGLL